MSKICTGAIRGFYPVPPEKIKNKVEGNNSIMED
jgi:hypothetical protein